MAQRVADQRRLAMLYLLTRADSIATGPEAWSSFRSVARPRALQPHARIPSPASTSLPKRRRPRRLGAGDAARAFARRRDRADRVRCRIRGRLGLDARAAGASWSCSNRRCGPTRCAPAFATLDEADEFIVVAHDRPGLFSIVLGCSLCADSTCTTRRSTRVRTVSRSRCSAWSVHTGPCRTSGGTRLGPEIAEALAGTLDVDSALAKKAAQDRRRGTPRKRARRRAGSSSTTACPRRTP